MLLSLLLPSPHYHTLKSRSFARSRRDQEGHRLLRQRGPVHDAPGALRGARKVPEESRGLPGAEALEVPTVLLRLQPGTAPGAQPGVRPGADAAVL